MTPTAPTSLALLTPIRAIYQGARVVTDMKPIDPIDTPSNKLDVNTPHSARIWNYWMGGKDNYDVDRALGDKITAIYPEIVTIAKQSRQFLIRAVRFLTRQAGIRQFLDIGTGLPAMQNTHEVAQSITPAAKIVYVDNDPLVLAHARALLTTTTPQGVTSYIDADVHNPEQIISAARNLLNFTEPIAVMFMGILGHVTGFAEARSIIAHVMAAVPSGSYLLLHDSTDTTETVREAAMIYADSGAIPYQLRSPDQIRSCFDGLQMVEPGLVPITQWRPRYAMGDVPGQVDDYGGLGRKP